MTEAETALEADQGPPLFRRGTALVRIARTEAPTVSEWFNRKTGALVLIPIEAMYLVERFTQAARWLKYDARMGGYRRIDCPVRVARTYMARCGTWKVPILTGIIESPTLRPDGTVLCTRGYDAETGLFLDPGATKFVPIPQEPTRENAIAALSKLREPLKDFPFVGPSDRAAALASILTAVVRWRLRSAPLFAFRAPKMASGKSLLADVVAMIATGRPAAVMSQGQNEEESRKRITALLVEGSSVICVDNIEEPFGGASICSVLTQTVWKDRILGQTRTVTVPTTATWLATGNNLIFTGDIVTRVVVCDLDPNCEHPEDRRFDVNLHKYVPDHRSELVSAALIVLRAYIVAGKPKLNVPVFGRFEEWSDLVRSALIWLGEADPCGGRRRIEVVDPVSQRLGAVLLAWSRAFESKTVTASEIIAQAKKHPESALGQSLRQVALDSTGNFDTHRLGMWLSTIERRIEGGLRVERRGKKQGIALWGVNSA